MNNKKKNENPIIGVYESNARGFGFVRMEGQRDLFISDRNSAGAFHKDLVQAVQLTPGSSDGRTEGKIVKVISHGLTTVVGTYKKNKTFGFVIPDDTHICRDIFVLPEQSRGAENNQKVVVKIRTYGDMKHKPEGLIIKVLGNKYDPGVDILSIAAQYEIPQRFNFDVRKQAAGMPQEVSAEEREGRRDLRDLFTVTVDGEDAKDLDDAITLSRENGIYHLGVHIADVSHYVTENSPLDRDALKRGTSVYLIDRVIPMLPVELSNGICSLNEGVDRLAFSCLMDIDENGCILGHEITESVIRVDRRLSYNGVMGDMTGGESDILDFEKLCIELSKKLRERRYERGAVDFDFPESRIILNEKGKPVDIHPYERNDATRMIEDFMLAANETVAEDAFWQEIPFLYRVHGKPETEKMERLRVMLGNFGYTLHFSNGEVYPMELAKLLRKIEGTDEEAMLSRMILRSMRKAVYSPENDIHFGLAAKYYTHFTSPIRRYPDLQIHRILKDNLHGKLNAERRLHYDTILPEVALSTSANERRADECEREVEKLKKVQYLRYFLGESFDGIISGVTKFGFYVELANTCEGLVHVTTLDDDYYEFLEDRFELVGQMTGRTFSLGQQVRIVVADTDEETKTAEFRLYEENIRHGRKQKTDREQ